jgi:hypothetical protein
MARSFPKSATRALLAGGVCLLALAVADRTVPVQSDLRIATEDGSSFTIGRVFFSNGLIGSAIAQSPGDVTIENVEIEGAAGSLRIPSITFIGSPMTREELQAILSGEGDDPIWQRLARISAQSFTAPEFVIAYEVEEASQEIVYRDVTARGIDEGRIAEITSASGELTVEAEGQSGTGGFGRTHVTGIDLPHFVRFYTEAAAEGEENPLRVVYESALLEDFRFADENDVEIGIGRVEATQVTARLLDRPLNEIAAELSELEGREDLTREDAGTLLLAIADMMDSVGIGDMQITDLSLRDSGDEQVTMTIDRMAASGVEAGGLAQGAIEGFSIETPQGSARIDAINSTGFSFAPMREAFRQMGADPAAEISRDSIRRLVPNLGTLTISGVASNFVDEESGDEMSFSLRGMEITATDTREGIPTNLRLAIDDLAFDIPADAEEDALVRLRDLGYERLDVSGALATRWNEATNELVISEMAFSGDEMGSIALRGALGNVTQDVFSANQAASMAALMGGTVKNLHLLLEDDGLVQRILEMQASEMGSTADALRMQFGMMATAMLPAMLGNSEQARELGQAVGQFLSQPGELEISATARDGAGIAFGQFLTITQPAGLLEQIDLSATAR